MSEEWKVEKAKDISCSSFYGLTPAELDELLEEALNEDEPTAEAGRHEEECQCGKRKDVGQKCWWCGN